MQSATRMWNMNTLEKSVRTRYWLETLQELLGGQKNLAAVVIFIAMMFGIVLCRTAPASVFIFVGGIIAMNRVVRGKDGRRGWSDGAADSKGWRKGEHAPDVARLLEVIERLEKRVVDLEAAITTKEFDWERRLNQTPPSRSEPAPRPEFH